MRQPRRRAERISTLYETETGVLRVFDRASDLDLAHAVPCSAAFVRIRHPGLWSADGLHLHEGALAVAGERTGFAASPQSWDEALAAIAQIADALGALHRERVVHNDVRPENIVGGRLGGSEEALHVELAEPGRTDPRDDLRDLGRVWRTWLGPAASRADALIDRMTELTRDRRPSTADDLLDELAHLGHVGPRDRARPNPMLLRRETTRVLYGTMPPMASISPLFELADDGSVRSRLGHLESLELWTFRDRVFVAPPPSGSLRISGRTLARPAIGESRGAPLIAGDVIWTGSGERLVIAGADPAPTIVTDPDHDEASELAIVGWTVIEQVGGGGSSETYRVSRPGRAGIAKQLRAELASQPEMLARWRREVRILRELDHHGSVRVLDEGITPDRRPYIVMEDAGREIAIGERSLADNVAIVRDVLAVLGAAHTRGIVHRDVKPGNIYPSNGFAKLGDFGIAKTTTDDLLTRSGAVFGTPIYMAPEQVRDAGKVDGRSDLYAIGCILYELLAGRPPDGGTTFNEILVAKLERDPAPLPSTAPPDLAGLTMRLLARDPDARPQTARAVRDALDAAAPPPELPVPPRTREIATGVFVERVGEWRSISIYNRDRRDTPRLIRHYLDALVGSDGELTVKAAFDDEDDTFTFHLVKGPILADERPSRAELGQLVRVAIPHYRSIDDGTAPARERTRQLGLLAGLGEDTDDPEVRAAIDEITILPFDYGAVPAPVPPGGYGPPIPVAPTLFTTISPPPIPPDPRPVEASLLSSLPRVTGKFAIGAVVGPWRVLRALGRGGMTEVFVVEHVVLGHRAAAKVLWGQTSAEIIGRFVDEARATNRLDHPNVVKIFEIARDESDTPFLVMELLHGGTLQELVGHCPIPQAIAIARQLAEALAAIHDVQIIHRDLKPANIVLVGDPPRVKVLDFGIAKVPRTSGFVTAIGQLFGTPAYMSPEQCRSSGEVDVRTDLYALGVTLFELVSGKQPIVADSVTAMLVAVGTQIPPAVTHPTEAVPPALVALIARLLEKNRDDRPAGSREVIAALDALVPQTRRHPTEDLLLRAPLGLGRVENAGITIEGLDRFRSSILATNKSQPVTIYVGSLERATQQQRARLAGMRFLARTRMPLFVPIILEHTLDDGSLALVRADPVPPGLTPGRVAIGAALAVGACTYRALATLRAAGRRAEGFTLSQVRASLASPATFACMLQPPIELDRAAFAQTRMALEIVDRAYQSPQQLNGMPSDADLAYAVGILIYALLVGDTPIASDAPMHEVTAHKKYEDPQVPRAAAPPAIARFVDGLVARAPEERARPPSVIEAELLALLATHAPDWQAAALGVLADAPPLADVAPAPPETLPALQGLPPGTRLRQWTVGELVHAGGDGTVYAVTDGNRRAVLKVWRHDLDPAHPSWHAFKRALRELGRRDDCPDVLDVDELVGRGRPRAYAVLETIDGVEWRALGSVPPQRALELSARLATAVAEIQAVIDGPLGDIAPGNVLVRGELDLVMLDVLAPGRPRAELGGYGTAGFLAPEVADGGAPTKASDQFSTGVLVAEILLSTRLFPERIETTAIPRGGFAPPIERAVAKLRATFDRDVADVVARMLAVDPAGRFATMTAVAARLRVVADRWRIRETARATTAWSSLQGLERRYPRLLGQAVRSWRLAANLQDRVRLGFGLAEAIVRYLAAIALADYLSGDPDPKIEMALEDLGRPLTFGTWLQLARSVGRALDTRGDAFMPELVEFFAKGSEGLATLEEIIPLRNRNAHGRPVIAEGDLPAIEPVVTAKVLELLGAIRFVARYPLLVAVHQQPRRGGAVDGSFLELHGTASDPERRQVRTLQAVPTDVVFVGSPDLANLLFLEPFVVQRACTRCGVIAHTYLISGATKKGEVTYHDLASDHGHVERPRDGDGTPRMLSEVIAARAELAIRRPLGAAAADAERFWDGGSPVRAGTVVANLVLDEEIGRGAFGIVYRAHDPRLHGVRAVKIVRPEMLGEDRTQIRRLEDEARKLERLGDHAGIVRVFELAQLADETNCAIVMELIEGGSLDDRLRAIDPPSLDEVFGFAHQLVEAVGYVHAHDIVHRDLKPANVLVATGGRVKLVDFGMARDLRASSSYSTGFGGGGATPMYCAPEQQAGGSVGPWTDIYALGLVLFDLLRGRPPTVEPQRRGIAIRHALRQLAAGVTPGELAHHGTDPRIAPFLEDLAAMTEPEPEQRPRSVALRV